MTQTTFMRQEMLETPERLAEQWQVNQEVIQTIARTLAADPQAPWWLTARGSSSHAGTFLATAVGLQAGHLVGQLTPSLFTLYEARPVLAGSTVIAISQSGGGPDTNATVNAANQAGALTIGMTNNLDSELAQSAEHVVNLAMGPEKAVAATKTYLGTLAASAHLVAEIAQDKALSDALAHFPTQLAERRDVHKPLDASALADFRMAGFVLGRGIGQAIAQEVALKFKEVCVTAVEAFSAAEFIHGPLTLIEEGVPVLILCVNDAAQSSLIEKARYLAGLGARVTLLGMGLDTVAETDHLRVYNRPSTGNVYTDAMALAFDCYVVLEQRSRALGYNPDQPPHVQKVTTTF